MDSPATHPLTRPMVPDAQTLDAAYRESAYLLAFPEIADAVADGFLPSGLDHFLRVGRADMIQGRRAIPETFRLVPATATRPNRLCFAASRDRFEEALYAGLFPQLARLVSQRGFPSLFDHWLECGYGDTASGQQRVNFVPRLATGDAPAQLRVARLDEAEYLMAFASGAPATSSAPTLDPAGHRRIDVRQYRSLRFGALLARPFGVNLFAPFTMPTPLGHTARATLQALRHAGLDVDAWPYDREEGALRSVSAAWTRRPRYRVNLLLVEPDQIEQLFELFAPGNFDDGYTVALLPWQLCPVRPHHIFAFTDIDEVWTGGAFEADAVANVAKVPVHIMPVPVQPSGQTSGPGEQNGSRGSFVFATLLDSGEAGRTTALAIIEAFRAAAEHLPATLIVAGEGAASLLGPAPSSIRIEDAAPTDDDLQRLLREADCFIAGHPNVGGTWAAAAALQAGTPVIGMSYAGTAEILDETVGYPVDYRLVELEQPLAPYGAGTVWAEPSVASLAARMREAMQDRDGRARRAQAAASRATSFSITAAGAAIARRLAELNLDVAKPRFMDGIEDRPPLPSGLGVASKTPALRPHLSFSLLAAAADDSDPEELQAIVDAAHAQSYGLWDLVFQPAAATRPGVRAWLEAIQGTSPRITVLPVSGQCRPGLVERARGRYVVYSKRMAQLPPDTLARIVDVLTDEPAIDIVSGPACDGMMTVRKQVLLGLGAPDLQPAEALSALFRARLQSVTRLARSLPGET